MGIKNYLIEGVSGSGKTSVCDELIRRNYHAIHGDRELAYQGDPETGEPINNILGHEYHIWDLKKVESIIKDKSNSISFFCGGSRNFVKFIDLFDGVFILDIDLDTLINRLKSRPEDEWGSTFEQQQLIIRLHKTKEDIPKNGILIDSTKPISHVVDEILSRC